MRALWQLNAARADDRDNDLCCAWTHGYQACARKATMLVSLSINRPCVKVCTQHAGGRTFSGLVPGATIRLKRKDAQ